MRDRLRLLLVTGPANRLNVGETWSNHQWVSRLSQRHDVTLLTYSLNHMPGTAREQLPAAEVVEWRDVPGARHYERLNATLKPGFARVWLGGRRFLRRALRGGRRFDLVHQIAPLALRYPCPATGLVDPLVVGPLGGSVPDPPGFAGELASKPWYVQLRRLDAWRLRHDPWLRETYERAAVVIGVAPYVAELLAPLRIRRFAIQSETGVVDLPERPAAGGQRDAKGPLRLLFVGRLVRTKGARDAIRAMARLAPGTDAVLDLVGDGEDRPACEREVARLGLGRRVRFLGRLPRTEVERHYAAASVFLFPSLCEASGNVVLEAMSHGLPLVIADRGGPPAAAGPDAALAVPVSDPEQYAAALARAIDLLAGDPARRRAMGRAARQRVETTHLWDRKVEWLEALYDSVLAGRTTDTSPSPAEAGQLSR